MDNLETRAKLVARHRTTNKTKKSTQKNKKINGPHHKPSGESRCFVKGKQFLFLLRHQMLCYSMSSLLKRLSMIKKMDKIYINEKISFW